METRLGKGEEMAEGLAPQGCPEVLSSSKSLFPSGSTGCGSGADEDTTVTRQPSSYHAMPKPQTACDGLQRYSILLHYCNWKEKSAA